jgi:hypothetical protein
MNPVQHYFVLIIHYGCKVANHVQKKITSVGCTPQEIMQNDDANFKLTLITTLRKPAPLCRTMKLQRVALIGKVHGISHRLYISNTKLTTKYFLSAETCLGIRGASHLSKYGISVKVQDFITHKQHCNNLEEFNSVS